MSNNWLIATNRLIRWAIIRSDAVCPADMPLSYLISSDQPTDNARFTSPSTIVFDIDMADAMLAQSITKWRLISLLYANSGSEDTFRVQGSTSISGLASSSYDSGFRWLWGGKDASTEDPDTEGYIDFARTHTLLFEPLGRTETYLRVTIHSITSRREADTASGFDLATYLDIGNLIVSDCITARNYDYSINGSDIKMGSYSEGVSEEVRATISEGGPKFPRERPQSRTRTISLQFTDWGYQGSSIEDRIKFARQQYYRGLSKLHRYCGQHTPILFCEDVGYVAIAGGVATVTPSDFIMERTVYGLLTGVQDVSIPQQNYFEVLVKVEELL